MPPQITRYVGASHLMDFVGDAGQVFTDEQWYEFCEARLRLIGPFFKDHTMSSLGRVHCIELEGRFTELGSFTKVQVGEDLVGAASVQGIFARGETVKDSEARFSDGHTWVYGVDRRTCTWTLCKVFFHGGEGHKGRGQHHPKEIAELSQVGLAEMCQSARVHPKDVFELLGQAVMGWLQAKTKQYNEALGLAQLISAEDMVLMARMSGGEAEDT